MTAVAQKRQQGRTENRGGFRPLPFGWIGVLFRLIASIRFPWLLFNVVFLMITILKVAILLQIGDSRYAARLASYDKSDVTTQIGVVVMRPDSLTLKLRDAVRPILEDRGLIRKRATILRLRPP